MKPESSVLPRSLAILILGSYLYDVYYCYFFIFFFIFGKIYKTPLILFNAAHIKTSLRGVRLAVDLSWKALG